MSRTFGELVAMHRKFVLTDLDDSDEAVLAWTDRQEQFVASLNREERRLLERRAPILLAGISRDAQ